MTGGTGLPAPRSLMEQSHRHSRCPDTSLPPGRNLNPRVTAPEAKPSGGGRGEASLCPGSQRLAVGAEG